MKIIITGSSGFIGRTLAKHLKKENLILLSRKFDKRNINKKVCKIIYNHKKKFKPKIECDVLIHAAAITPQKYHKFSEYKKINFLGLKNLIKNFKINKKLIFLSTTDIYKNWYTKKVAKEKNKVNFKELSDYAKSKFLCEVYLKNLDKKKYNFKKIILRLPGIVGKNNHKNFLSNIVDRVINKEKIFFFNGERLFNNIYHVDYLGDFINSILKKNFHENYNIINIATNNPIKVKNIFKLITKKKKIFEIHSNKKDYSFIIDVSKFNKYYKKMTTTKILKKYFRSNRLN